MKDKKISEEELLEELDTMYQRVADIEKEEAEQTPTTFPRQKPKQKKKKPVRTILVAVFICFIALGSILAVTVFDPMTVLQRLRTGGSQPPAVVIPRPHSKRPAVVPSPTTPKPPAAVATSPSLQKPQAVAASSPGSLPPPLTTSPAAKAPASATPSPVPQRPASELPSVQAKQEAVKSPPQGTEKSKPISQETMQAYKPLPRGKYFAIQVGAFRDMENVRELVEAFKREGLEAYWVPMKGGSKGTLYRVFVGHFTNTNEAAEVLKDKKIFKNYPDSFIKAVSSSKTNR
jgi:cell division septation protein DedD